MDGGLRGWCGAHRRMHLGGLGRARSHKGDFWALQGAWFAIPTGQLFCLLGPNGAGAWPLSQPCYSQATSGWPILYSIEDVAPILLWATRRLAGTLTAGKDWLGRALLDCIFYSSQPVDCMGLLPELCSDAGHQGTSNCALFLLAVATTVRLTFPCHLQHAELELPAWLASSPGEHWHICA